MIESDDDWSDSDSDGSTAAETERERQQFVSVALFSCRRCKRLLHLASCAQNAFVERLAQLKNRCVLAAAQDMTECVHSPLRDLLILQRGRLDVKEAVWRVPASAEELATAAIKIVNDLHDAALKVQRIRGEEQAREPLLDHWPGSVPPVTMCLPDKSRSRRGRRTAVDVHSAVAVKRTHASLFLWLSMFADLAERAYDAAASLLTGHRHALAASSIPKFCKAVLAFVASAERKPPRAGPVPAVVSKAVASAVRVSGLTVAAACIPLLESWVQHTAFDIAYSTTTSVADGAPETLLHRSQLLLEYGTALGVWVPLDMRRHWLQQPQFLSRSREPLQLLPPVWLCSMLYMTLLNASGGYATLVSGGTLSALPFAMSRRVPRLPSFKQRASLLMPPTDTVED